MDMTYQIPETAACYQTHSYQPRRDRLDQGSEQRPTRTGAILASIVIVIAAVIGFGTDVAASGSDSDDAIEIYVVQPGDTLWDIAASVSVPGEDIRPLVDGLQEVAGSSSLEIGQQLIIDHAMIRR